MEVQQVFAHCHHDSQPWQSIESHGNRPRLMDSQLSHEDVCRVSNIGINSGLHCVARCFLQLFLIRWRAGVQETCKCGMATQRRTLTKAAGCEGLSIFLSMNVILGPAIMGADV